MERERADPAVEVHALRIDHGRLMFKRSARLLAPGHVGGAASIDRPVRADAHLLCAHAAADPVKLPVFAAGGEDPAS
jgi:hypothetical protein